MSARPLTHERTFRIRHYECDSYGHVNHANYVRYMQEAAFDASAAAGYDVARYQQMNRAWLVRETDITYLRPLVHGDSVVVKTWVGGFRRVRSRRMYELRRISDNEPVARASTDWVFLESDTLRPVSIPQELIRAFFPESAASAGLTEETQAREPFPKAPPAPDGVFTLKRPVGWRDIDPAQHVNNANYLAYIEDCGVEVAAAHGWPMTRMMAEGFGIVARRFRIEYRLAAVLGDTLEIATWISDVKRATAMRHYTIKRVSNGELIARAHVLWVWVDLESNRPIRIPTGFIDEFAANLSPA
jgi:acyl-CoA thioester hydrolase